MNRDTNSTPRATDTLEVRNVRAVRNVQELVRVSHGTTATLASKSTFASRTTLALASVAMTASLVFGAAACSDDASTDLTGTGTGSGTDASVKDAARSDAGTTIPQTDASIAFDASTTADAADAASPQDSAVPDAADAADATPPNFCATQAGLAFCTDFDDTLALSGDGGVGSWDNVRQNPTTQITLSNARSVSTPYSALFANAAGDPEPGPAVFKTITPAAGVTSAIYEFDIYVDKAPVGSGGFVSDFQFQDGDNYGFRMIVDTDGTGALNNARIEHNPGNIPSNLTGFSFGAWHHMKFAMELTTLAADAGNNAHFTAYLDKGATPVVDVNYDAPFAKAAFARIAAGLVYPFGGARGWAVSYDNVTLKLQ